MASSFLKKQAEKQAKGIRQTYGEGVYGSTPYIDRVTEYEQIRRDAEEEWRQRQNAQFQAERNAEIAEWIKGTSPLELEDKRQQQRLDYRPQYEAEQNRNISEYIKSLSPLEIEKEEQQRRIEEQKKNSQRPGPYAHTPETEAQYLYANGVRPKEEGPYKLTPEAESIYQYVSKLRGPEPEPKAYKPEPPSQKLTPDVEAERLRRLKGEEPGTSLTPYQQYMATYNAQKEQNAKKVAQNAESAWPGVGRTVGGMTANFISGAGQPIVNLARGIEGIEDMLYRVTGNETFNLDRRPGLRNSEALKESDQFAALSKELREKVGPLGQQLIDAAGAAGNMLASFAFFGMGASAAGNPVNATARMANMGGGKIGSALGRLGARVGIEILSNPGNFGISLGSAIGSYSEAYANGAGFGQALTNGLLKGMTEYYSNKLFSGTPYEDSAEKGYVTKLIEQVANDLGGSDVLRFINETTGGRAMNWIFDKAGEGLEEVVTGVMDPLIDRLTYDRTKDLATAKELTEEFIGGVLLSFLMEGGEAVISGIQSDKKKAEQEVKARLIQRGIAPKDAKAYSKDIAEAIISMVEDSQIRNAAYDEKSIGNPEIAAKAAEGNDESLKRYASAYNREESAKELRRGANPAEVDQSAFLTENEAKNFFYIWNNQGAEAADAYYDLYLAPALEQRRNAAMQQFIQKTVREWQAEDALMRAEARQREEEAQRRQAQAEETLAAQEATTPPVPAQENAQQEERVSTPPVPRAQQSASEAVTEGKLRIPEQENTPPLPRSGLTVRGTNDILNENRQEASNGQQAETAASAEADERARAETAAFREAANKAAGSEVLDRAEWRAGLGRLLQAIRNSRVTRSSEQRRIEAARITNQAEAGNPDRLSAKELGVADGSDDKLAIVIDAKNLGADAEEAVARLAKQGVSLKFISGQMWLNERDVNGDPVKVRAYVSADRKNIIVQADNPRVSWQQLLAHEELHRLIKEDADYRKRVMDALLADKKVKPYLSQIIDRYADAYHIANPKLTDEDIIEELLADYRAGFDMLDPLGTNRALSKVTKAAAKDIRAVEKNYTTNGGKPAPAGITETFAEGKNSVEPPYKPGTKAGAANLARFEESLSPKARETYDLFKKLNEISQTGTAEIMVGSGEARHLKRDTIADKSYLAEEWNDNVKANEEFAETARKLVATLPKIIKDVGHFNDDGTIAPTEFEKTFLMNRSFIQRVVDALPKDTVQPTMVIDGHEYRITETPIRDAVGGEEYRQAIIAEKRRLYKEGKLPTVALNGLTKDNWGAMGFLATNTKTGASGDFTTFCPQMYYNNGCFYCYRRAALTTGQNNKLTGERVWYSGEILQLRPEDVKSLNKKGGLRIQSFGDWQNMYTPMLADMLYDAQMRGLQIKIITKEPSMIETVARLREQALGLSLYFNLSADYTIERRGLSDNYETEKAYDMNSQRPFLEHEWLTEEHGKKPGKDVGWKRALTVQEANEYRKKYPWVNTRIVATTLKEYIRGLIDPTVDVVTGYHGDIKYQERVSSETGETLIEVEALGDSGMPQFTRNEQTGEWEIARDEEGKLLNGRTKTHKALCDAIVARGLQEAYYAKACCITGRCYDCQGKCGGTSNQMSTKNATNRDADNLRWVYLQMEAHPGEGMQNSQLFAENIEDTEGLTQAEDLVDIYDREHGIEPLQEKPVAQQLKEREKYLAKKQREAERKAAKAAAEKAGATPAQVEANEKYSTEVNTLTYFSGGGLVDHALRDVIGSSMAVEYDKGAAAVYALNNGDVFVGDVRDFSKNELDKMKDIDYFHASPVCKNYSRMNTRRTDVSDNDTDITTAQATADAIRRLMPKVFTLEQVPGYKGSKAYNIIADTLTELGYAWDDTVAKASDYGGATSRERLMLRAVRDGALPALPEKVKGYSWFEATADLIDGLNTADRISPFLQERINATPELQRALANQTEPILILGGTPGGKAWWASANEPSPSITTDMTDSRIIMPDGTIKKPDARFYARIMGLPDSYQFTQYRGKDNQTQGQKVIGNGVPVQLTQKFFGNLLDSALDTGVKFSTEIDANYLAAVESGDMETAQRMVDEAAKRAGYVTAAYHGTDYYKEIRVFKGGKNGYLGPGIYLTPNKGIAQRYADKSGGNGTVYNVYAKMENPFVVTEAVPAKEILRKLTGSDKTFDRRMAKEGWESRVLTKADMKKLQELGYDGIVWRYGTSPEEYLVFDSSQIKSADPVTYDDDGNIIPLSQRFNPADMDIRYSVEIDPDVAKQFSMEGIEERQVQSLLRENEELKKKLKDAKAQIKTSDRTQPREEDVRRMARDILKAYSSKAEGVNESLRELAHTIMSNDTRWTDVRDQAVRLAGKILENSSVLVGEDAALNREIRNAIRAEKITYTNKGDIADYGQWRKDNFGKLKIAKGGIPVDTRWEELQDTYGEGYFPDDIKNPADQIVYLSELYDRLQDVYENPYNQNMAEASEFLANDIIDRVISGEMRQAPTTYADRAETRLARETLRGELRVQKVMERLQAERERRNEKIAELKEHYKSKEAKGRENRKARDMRAKIIDHAKQMTTELLKPTDKKHVPESLRKSVAAVLSAIDLGSGYDTTTGQDGKSLRVGRGTEGAEQTKRTKAFMELREALLKEADGLVLDPELLGTVEEPGSLTRLVTEMADVPIANMNTEQLQVVYDALRGIEGAVRSANRMLSSARWAAVGEAADAIRSENGNKGPVLQLAGAAGRAQDLTRLDMLTPEGYFHRLGKSGQAVFKMLRGAQDQFITNMTKATNDTQKIVGDADVGALEKEKHTVTMGGEKVTMTTAQIMELYCLMQRDQGLQHITTGGIMVEPVRQGIKQTTQAEPLHPSMEELLDAVRLLTPEEVRLATAMQDYLSKDMAELGNEATLAVYGYKKFGQESKYWKIRSNKNEIQQSIEKETQTTSVANRGFTKAVNPQANTSVKIGSIFDTYSQSVNDMATYAAWLAVGEDVNRIRNYVFRDGEGQRTGTVKGILDRVIGSGGANYLQRLLADIANGTGMDDAGLTSGFVGAYKAAAIGANIRVIIQQPTAILRAAEMIDPKYLAEGLKNPMKSFERAKEYSPIAQWKDWGYFDINTGRKMKDVLFENSSKLEKVRQVSMAMAGKADSFAWGQLWGAVEAETKAKTDLKPGTKDFYEACAERFNDIIDHTQVVDGILQRSQIMRSKNAITRMAVSFMSEPTKQYNQFMSAVYDYRHSGDKKQAKQMLARTTFSMLAAGVMNVLAQSIVDALRNGDRERKYWEKLLQAFLGYNPDDDTFGEKFKTFAFSNMGELINPATYLPYAKDIMSIIQGYSVDRMDMDGISDTITAITRLAKALNGEGKQTVGYSLGKAVEQGAKLLGLSAYNVDRDLTALITTIANDADMPVLQYYLNRYRYRPGDNLSKELKGILWDARQKNDGSYDIIVEHLLKDGYTQEQIDTAVMNRLSDESGFTEARKAADAEGNNNGSYDLSETLEALENTTLSEEDRDVLLEAKLSDKQYGNYTTLLQYSDYDTWLSVMREMPANLSQAKIEAVLDKRDDLTTKQKAAYWQVLSGSKSTKNNPYSQEIGAEILNAKAENEPDKEPEKVAQMRTTLTGLGLQDSKVDALAPVLGGDGSNTSKWRAVANQNLGKDQQDAVLKSVMTDAMYRNWSIASGENISLDSYVKGREAYVDLDDSGTDQNSEWTAALEKVTFDKDTTRNNYIKGVLWQIYTGSTSTKNNPFDKTGGQKVLDAKGKGGGKGTGSNAPARIPTLRLPEAPRVEKPSSGLRIRDTQPSETRQSSGLRLPSYTAAPRQSSGLRIK